MIAATAANLAPTLAIGHPWPALLQAPRRGRPEPSAAARIRPTRSRSAPPGRLLDSEDCAKTLSLKPAKDLESRKGTAWLRAPRISQTNSHHYHCVSKLR